MVRGLLPLVVGVVGCVLLLLWNSRIGHVLSGLQVWSERVDAWLNAKAIWGCAAIGASRYHHFLDYAQTSTQRRSLPDCVCRHNILAPSLGNLVDD
ncbi:hypothetical protein D3C81_1936930 [compost metagenome]